MKKLVLAASLIAGFNAFSQIPGNKCGATQVPLPMDYEIPMDKFNYYFTDGPDATKNHVNLGLPCGATYDAKLNIRVDTVTSYSGPDARGIDIFNYGGKGNSSSNFGVFAQVFNLSTLGGNPGTISTQSGLTSVVGGGQINVAVSGRALWTYPNPGAGSFGGEFEASGTNPYNVGVHGTASGGTLNYAGVFDGDVLINAGSGTYALNVNGSAYLSTGTLWTTSDKKFKQNITPLNDVTNKIKKLSGYTYNFKTEDFPEKHFDKNQHIGFVAQELREVFPQLVQTDKNGDLTVDYQGMIPVLLESIKSQQKQLDTQQDLINQLLQKSGGATGIGNNSNGLAGFSMEQNEPNPFTHETVVRYNLPESINTAYMAVYDLTGKQISTFPIIQKGVSSLTITSEKLSPGIYIYSIVADGKVVDSKRMMVADK